MKCEFCGGNLDLEAAYCPHCGKPNSHALRHIEDMDRYQGRFEDTRQDVYKTARRYSDVMVRVIIAAVLAVLCVALLVVRGNAYRIRYSIRDANNRAHKAEHTAVMDAYLEQEDFLQLADYCENHGLGRYGSDFREYYYICNLARNYQQFYEQLMKIVFPSRYTLDTAKIIELMCSDLDYFYRDIGREDYYDISEEGIERTRMYGEIMSEHIGALLMTYCHLTREDVAELPGMSNAKRAVLIEERMSDGE